MSSSSFSSHQPFAYLALNGWINDLSHRPRSHEAWPSITLDEALLEDYLQMFVTMRRLGFNHIVIWGLYVANDWPTELSLAVTPQRGVWVERLIAAAHEQNIQVLSGLGTYSWGFAEIIRTHPHLDGGNPDAMCASEPDSHVWMERIVDFVFERFPIDGVSMQPADLGRCRCERCAALTDASYYAGLIERTGAYIRARWPGKITGMSNWGISFQGRENLELWRQMSRNLDYLVDYDDSAGRYGEAGYRGELIAALGASFGTTGGFVVEPPQHWERDRWFLPTCRQVHEHLQKLNLDGGRACEFFYHILHNPSSEITLHVAGRTLSAPQSSLQEHLLAAIDELYGPLNEKTRLELADFFLRAEQIYFKHLKPNQCGTLRLEPLYGDSPGPPIYLQDELNASQRAVYSEDFAQLRADFEQLCAQLPCSERVARIHNCLRNVQLDLENLSVNSTDMMAVS